MNITNLIALIVAVSTLITSIAMLIRVFPMGKKIDAVKEVGQITQDIVNGKNDSLLNRTAQLESELQANQIPVPPDPNVPINQGKS